MQQFIAQYIFICAMYLFHRKIAQRMIASPEYFNETMFLIDALFSGTKAFLWKTRAVNLMLSYKDQRHV